MDLRVPFQTLDNPNDILNLKNILSRLAFELDAIYTTSAPNGNISANQGTRAVYLNGATYEVWTNTDGATAWQRNSNQDDVVLLTGNQTIAGIKTFSSIPLLPASDPTTANQASRKTYVDGKFDTSTGHDHDGSDSKTVLATNLAMTGITNGHFLYNNAGTLAGITSPGLSNVIFSWIGASVADTDLWGLVNSNILTHDMSTYAKKYEYFGVLDNTYRTIVASKFIKIAGISTVTINARLWSNTTGATAEAVLSVDVGGASNTVKSVTSATPTWVTTSDIDVSGLTDGTTYDITIQLKNETNAGWSSYCSGVILTGS